MSKITQVGSSWASFIKLSCARENLVENNSFNFDEVALQCNRSFLDFANIFSLSLSFSTLLPYTTKIKFIICTTQYNKAGNKIRSRIVRLGWASSDNGLWKFNGPIKTPKICECLPNVSRFGLVRHYELMNFHKMTHSTQRHTIHKFQLKSVRIYENFEFCHRKFESKSKVKRGMTIIFKHHRHFWIRKF